MLPAANTSHVLEARKLLISQFQGKPNIQGFLDTNIRRLQDVEDVLWDIVDSRILADATGAQLDSLGGLVKEIRRGRDDVSYRVGIGIKIKVNRSKGRTVDIIEIAGLANTPNNPTYEDHRYLNFHVETYSQVGERFLADSLTKARAASSYGCLVASDLPTSELLRFDDAVTPEAGIWTFSDSVSGQGRLTAACYGLPSAKLSVPLTGDPLAYPGPTVGWIELETGE